MSDINATTIQPQPSHDDDATTHIVQNTTTTDTITPQQNINMPIITNNDEQPTHIQANDLNLPNDKSHHTHISEGAMALRMERTMRTLHVLEILADGTWQICMVRRTDLLVLAREAATELFGEEMKSMAQPRDMRLLDQDVVVNSAPALLPRLMCTIVSLDKIRALILRDRMYLSLPEGADLLIRRVREKLDELREGVQDDDDASVMERHPGGPHGEKDEEEVQETTPNKQDENNIQVPDDKERLLRHSDGQRTTGSNDDGGGGGGGGGDNRPTRILSVTANDQYLKHEMRAIPFELRALEAVLSTLVSEIDREFHLSVAQECRTCLRAVQRDPTGATLEKLKQSTNKANALHTRVIGIREALVDIAEDDEIMAYMHFASTAKNPKAFHDESRPLDKEAIFEVEMLLEVYMQQLAASIKTMEDLKNELEVAESFVRLKLDVARNKLLKLNIAVQMTTAAAAIGAYIVGVFGMNLNSQVQDVTSPPLFWIVAGITLFGGITLVVTFMVCLQRNRYLLT